MLTLFSTEQIILTSGSGNLNLTNYRVNYQYKDFGSSHYNSIFLEDIGSIQSNYKSSPVWLIIAALALLFGLYSFFITQGTYAPSENYWVPFIIAIIFFALWLVSRTRTVEVNSKSGKSLTFLAKQWSHEETISFIEAVQLAKAQRVFKLYGS